MLPLKVIFPSSKSNFSTNPSFRLVETYFLSSGNSIFLFGAFSLLLETNGANQFSKTFSWYWKLFSLIFLPEEAEFINSGNVFFKECFILCSGNWFSGQYEPFFYIYIFRDICNWKHFVRLAETYFWANLSARVLEKDFFSSRNHLLYMRLYF